MILPVWESAYGNRIAAGLIELNSTMAAPKILQAESRSVDPTDPM